VPGRRRAQARRRGRRAHRRFGRLPRPAADHPEVRGPDAPIIGTVQGLTGAAATRQAGGAATQFKALTKARSAAQLDELHTAWGTAFNQPQAKGIRATHSVLTGSGTTTKGLGLVWRSLACR
jgi:hypothetical protein